MVKMSISATSSELDSREAAILAFLSALAGSQATVFLTVHRLQRRWAMTEPGNSTRTVDSTKAIIKDFGVNVK